MVNLRKVLVTGGAGYIGSHVVKQLGDRGYEVVVYDNCSTGSPEAVLSGELVIGDLADTETLLRLMKTHQFQAVLHFAASLVVPESVQQPLRYYTNNTRNTLNLLRCCSEVGIEQFIFSSTAAVYGQPEQVPVSEQTPTQPINPYGRSKLMSEWMIQDYGAVSGLRYVILRYFNVAGADPSGQIGNFSTGTASHLIGAACDVVLQRRRHLQIFGTDYPTPDGTAIRDYIHVEDLATAHLDALHYLEAGNPSQIFNCGYGQGYSVRQVIDCMKQVTNVDFAVLETDRRPGDPACVIACADQIRSILGWTPQHDHLETIVKTAIAWEIKKLQAQPQGKIQPDPRFRAIAQQLNQISRRAAG